MTRNLVVTFDNGVKIPKAARILFRNRTDLFEYFDVAHQLSPLHYCLLHKINNAPN